MFHPLAFSCPHVTALFTARSLGARSQALAPRLGRRAVAACATSRGVTTISSSASGSGSTSGRAARKQVGIVVIGNEILSGKTVDKNLGTLARHVEQHGAVLHQAVTIRDDVSEIARHVREMSDTHDLVFTSGGIGPTLDDVTYAGVAEAFGLQLARHDATVARMTATDMELNDARLRMAMLPHPCDVLWTDDSLWVPLVVARNVYVLPGIPSLFARMLTAVPPQRFGAASRRVKRVVLCDVKEGDLAQCLLDVAASFDALDLGSYPATTDAARQRYTSMITLEGDDAEDVERAAEIVRQRVDGRYEQVAQ